MSTVVPIPGGEAVLYDSPAEMSPRRRRPIEIVSARLGKRLQAVKTATRIFCDGDLITDHSADKDTDGNPLFTGGDLQITEHELGLLLRLNDVSALAVLKSWTIDHPLPHTEAEFLEIPGDVYEALVLAAAKVNAQVSGGGEEFGVDAVEDLTSPTGP